MNDGDSAMLADFRRMLGQHGRDFVYTAAAQPDCATIRFLGRFRNAEVIWDATIMTLAHYHRSHGKQASHDRDSQFIEIDECAGVVRPIRIGLQLDHIDEPAIQKTIIVIRNYKRLHTGRHEFAYHTLQR